MLHYDGETGQSLMLHYASCQVPGLLLHIWKHAQTSFPGVKLLYLKLLCLPAAFQVLASEITLMAHKLTLLPDAAPAGGHHGRDWLAH